jgi:hypothetical protein
MRGSAYFCRYRRLSAFQGHRARAHRGIHACIHGRDASDPEGGQADRSVAGPVTGRRNAAVREGPMAIATPPVFLPQTGVQRPRSPSRLPYVATSLLLTPPGSRQRHGPPSPFHSSSICRFATAIYSVAAPQHTRATLQGPQATRQRSLETSQRAIAPDNDAPPSDCVATSGSNVAMQPGNGVPHVGNHPAPLWKTSWQWRNTPSQYREGPAKQHEASVQ